MSTISDASSSVPRSGPNDISTALLVSEKLTSDNYREWSQSMILALDGRDKLEYITGEAKKPSTSDTKEFRKWKSENALVSSWLINAMSSSIKKSFMYLPSAFEIWEALRETYSSVGNRSRIFDIKKKLWELKQNHMSLDNYYLDKSALWQEFDALKNRTHHCGADAREDRKEKEEERVYELLAGLNMAYDDVRSRILSQEPLPSVREAYSILRNEEDRRKSMLQNHSAVATPEVSALTARSSNPRGSKNQLFCDHCKRSGHTKDTCWDLHGKPADWKPRKGKGKGYAAEVSKTGGTPQDDPLNKIMDMLATLQTTKQPTASVVKRGNFFKALAVIKGLCTGNCWIIDSGASDHMTDDKTLFTSYTPITKGMTVRIADDSESVVTGIGTVKVSPELSLHSVLHVPKLKCNLLSVSQLAKEERCRVNFFATCCSFQDLLTGTTIGSAKELDGLYYLGETESPKIQSCNKVSLPRSDNLELWHKRLGHPNFNYMSQLFPSLISNQNASVFHCDSCEKAKHHRTSFQKIPYKPSQPFSTIHSDLWGPSRTPNRSHSKWFITFIDDHTRVSWVYLLKDKTEVYQTFLNFHSMIQTQFQTNIKILHTDNGTEYFNQALSSFLTANGIVHKSTCPNTPQQNGIAERKNRHILETARAIMFSSNVPKYHWDDAVLTATFLINRMPSKPLSYKTPLQLLHTYFNLPYLENTLPLRVFGCTSYVHLHHSNKLDPRAIRCIFLGYSHSQKGYKCYDPISKRLIVTCDVTFHEKIPYFSQSEIQGENVNDFQTRETPEVDHTIEVYTPSLSLTPNTSTPDTSDNPDNVPKTVPVSGGDTNKWGNIYTRRHKEGNEPQVISTHQESEPEADSKETEVTESSDLDLPIAVRKKPRSCTRYPIENHVSYKALSSKYKAFISHLGSIRVPDTIDEAMATHEWRQAVMEEMEALKRNKTWNVVDLPQGKKPVGCKWVFTPKYKADGTLEKYKARLVAKGFTQIYGEDYTETFAPVAKLNTIRILLSIAVNLDWGLHQLDVKNAFLNGELKEEVYMKLPPGFPGKKPNQVCKLKRSLYGLKQSPRAWFDRFTRVMKKHGFTQGQSDHTLFVKHYNGKMTILTVYVDDIILTGDDEVEINQIKKALAREFQIKDLGEMKYFLGMEVARSKGGIYISQRKYVLDLLKESGMTGCRPSDTPIQVDKINEGANLGKSVDIGNYQRMVGKLIYLSHTRPDIAFAVSMVSQHSHDPKQKHLNEVYRILRYLKGSPGRGLLFKKTDKRNVELFTDADWAGDQDDRRSTSGYCTYVWGNLVTWRSKKQSVVARSSAEAEYRAVALGICEAIWIKRTLEDLKRCINLPINVYCDNMAAINIAHNPVQHDRTKHVEIDRHFIREKVDKGIVDLRYIPSKEQTADILTKGLSKDGFKYLISKLNLIDIYSPT
ncbi:hypothetical protein QN277_020331 [Acacia crassicarpa]|uniref:Integrase catalytic domain-containing protein n=2 Tax=Acacia crassicarpa TaxID=499986 RepID=A0AAE1MNY1_9FABA|nr:hypothetical protein QN277_009575 [Acacia crassicarpa]KAK4257071.1 hypothetical protein QN277_006708 [Acacia crassicarpa]KAK4260558.1 hypothetical protein QN277_003655 [Acacia crassicarpa]KAK4266692.1 hypothetical protein QN277_027574 [Acacia crassicarpa]KAK4271330.1 hypothetical protein QN277_020040 [Acacia crassicarpa]